MVTRSVWLRLGDVSNYIEPFAGSAAMLLARPHPPRIETLNDYDCMVANFWRATQRDPEAVVEHADGPVNECVPAGTIIATPSGPIRIEEVRSGMLVWGFDGENVVQTRVVATKESETTDCLVSIGGSLRLTGNHPVWTRNCGYVEAAMLSAGMTIGVLCDEQEVDHLHADGPYHDRDSLCRRHVPEEATAKRACLSRKDRRENTPRLLDQVIVVDGSQADSQCGSGRRWRLEDCGASLDCFTSENMPSGESHGWRRGNSWVHPNTRTSSEVVRKKERIKVCAGESAGNEGSPTHTRGAREDCGVWRRKKTYTGISCETLTGTSRQAAVCGASGETSTSKDRSNSHRRMEAEDFRFNDGQKAGSVHRDGKTILIGHGSRNVIELQQVVGESSDQEAVPVQRCSPPIRLTVYNFQTETGNYFAGGVLVHNCDLHARHRWLVYSEHAAEWRRMMRTDPDHFDAKIAGWWCWGLCMWIGSGWCDVGAEASNRVKLTGGPEDHGMGIHASGGAKIWEGRGSALIGSERSVGRGVTKMTKDGKTPGKMPRMTGARKGDEYYGGLGVHMEQIPDVRPQLADAYDIGRGVHSHGEIGTCEQRRLWLLDWFGKLRDRLRNVRVCCGDWERVCGSPSTTTRLGTTGIFLDPPYAKDCERMQQWARHLRGDGPEPAAKGKATNRSGDLYATDDHDVDHLVARVLNYCRERGSDPAMRIALCGYDGEHNELEELGWQPLAWKANGGYANRHGVGANENAARERVWFSPRCLPEVPEDSNPFQMSLFE
jgi:hypothetical protein